MLISKLLKKLVEFEKNPHDAGPSYYYSDSHLELYSDGSGILVVNLHRKDGSNPVEKLCNAVGIDAVTKNFSFSSPKELMLLLENKDLLKSKLE